LLLKLLFLLSGETENLKNTEGHSVLFKKGFLTQGVREPVKHFIIHAKKWVESRVPDIIVNELVIPYKSS
jgi:hypothetical protein